MPPPPGDDKDARILKRARASLSRVAIAIAREPRVQVAAAFVVKWRKRILQGLVALLVWGFLHSQEYFYYEAFGSTTYGYIPVLGYPLSAHRGQLFLGSLLSVDFPVDELVIFDNSEGEPDSQCAIQRVQALVAARALPIKQVTVLPRPPMNAGVSAAWNAIVHHALVARQMPWVVVSNDDVGYDAGSLASLARATWLRHHDYSLLLANRPMPGIGHAFSAFALTRRGYGLLGLFDENFWPAYVEDCDYWTRAQLTGALFRRVWGFTIQHKVEAWPPDADHLACVGKLTAEGGFAPRFSAAALKDIIYRVTDNGTTPNSNHAYLWAKWGGRCGWAGFRHPFNDPRLPVSYWKLDRQRRQNIFDGVP